jgi:hypothetical protein
MKKAIDFAVDKIGPNVVKLLMLQPQINADGRG